ncbi:MAG: hypothetical protein JNK64_06310 [Myxococcales bacterium]|nr:hypothetical protein [Myxococcales bacterium]
MGIGHRLVATLGFVVPAALAAWITLGVDAHAAPPDIRSFRFQQHGAFAVRGWLFRPCEPAVRGQMICECDRRIEIVIAPTSVRAAVYEYEWGRQRLAPLTVARDDRGWDELQRWFAARRAEPIFEGRRDYRVVARDGVAYRDIVRALEIADGAGFTWPTLVASRAAEIDRPGPLRVTVTAAGVGADFDGAFPAHLPLVEGDRAWRGLATWLAERHADPRLDANDLDIVIDATLGARPRDVALARRALAQAGYDDWRTATRVDAAPAAIPPPPTALTR